MSDKNYSAYQKGVIKRYYENRDTLALQKLAEIVSDMYVETSEKKLAGKWKRVKPQLLAAGVHEHQADAIVNDQDLGALARLVSELT